jgi:Glucose / Sorbosone dehydrogenase/IPT/TIG domain
MSRVGRLLLVLATAASVLASREGQGASSPPRVGERLAPIAPSVELAPVAIGLPDITSITNAGDNRLFVTLQRGQVMIWDGTQVRTTPFLDLSTLVICCGEQGLLSIAFHPNYALNGFFFVDYTNLTGQTIVARYKVSDFDRNLADAFSGVTLLTIDQPYTNHNGGQLQFGPDGDLYIGMGDGGSANDPQCHAQSSDSLLGKLLRIDVNQNVEQAPYYGIPLDNPFVRTTGPPEAWAIGLRNPWRFSFDRLTGDLFIGDVGQSAREEIDYQPLSSGGGQNYGWKVMESTLCGAGGTSGCTVPPLPCGDPGYTLPILEYSHDNGACAVTGGYRYRGTQIPDLVGSYVYGDYCSGTIWAATLVSGTWSAVVLPISAGSLTTFGEDRFGELHAGASGTLYAIVPPAALPPTISSVTPASDSTRGGGHVVIAGTNFTSQTTVAFGLLPASASVQSSTRLVAVAPPHPVGLVDVTVTNPGVAPATLAKAFGYVHIPTVPPPDRSPRVVTR